MLTVCGPAAVVLDAAFANAWGQAGPPLPSEDTCGDPGTCGDFTVQVVAGVPFEGRIYRATQLIAAAARERLWITDAYLVPPAPLYAALIDAARNGVDVRVLVPGTSDLVLLRNVTRVGYRELLRAGVRIFEWRGAMVHAKTLVADHRWARVGSSNLNVSSLFANYELDVLADNPQAAEALATQFRRDLLMCREVVLEPRGSKRPPRLVRAPASDESGSHADLPTAPRHQRSVYELSAVAVVALRRVAGGLRRTIAGSVALIFLLIGVLLVVFPRVMGGLVAAVMFWLSLGFGVYAFGKRRAREREDGD
jgi:cardiolipin synthase